MIVLIRSHNINNLPCCFQLNCLHQVVLFKKKEDYSLIKVFDFYSIGSQWPIFHKIGNTRGVQKLKIRGARIVSFVEDNPRDWIILAKNAGCLLFMLFGSS